MSKFLPDASLQFPDPINTANAKAVCRRCLVLDECLAYALADESLGRVGRDEAREIWVLHEAERGSSPDPGDDELAKGLREERPGLIGPR
jgi:Transcription factor WhiB